jgi:hypothetical protein
MVMSNAQQSDQPVMQNTAVVKAARKSPLEPKDYLTITLSVLAFVVSAGSAYFNILRTEEAVSVIVTKQVLAKRASDEVLYISPREEGELVFINSGNRSIAIYSVNLLYVQPEDRHEPKCPASGVEFRTDVEVTIVKPNEIIAKKIKITGPLFNHQASLGPDGLYLFPISRVELCAEVGDGMKG